MSAEIWWSYVVCTERVVSARALAGVSLLGAAIAPPYFGAVQESRSDTARLNTGLVAV